MTNGDEENRLPVAASTTIATTMNSSGNAEPIIRVAPIFVSAEVLKCHDTSESTGLNGSH